MEVHYSPRAALVKRSRLAEPMQRRAAMGHPACVPSAFPANIFVEARACHCRRLWRSKDSDAGARIQSVLEVVARELVNLRRGRAKFPAVRVHEDAERSRALVE